MVILGCRPSNRLTEQHDIFFTIARSLKEAVPEMLAFWPEAKGKIHIDAWREVHCVDGYEVQIHRRSNESSEQSQRLFFINLGGYLPGVFDELHHKILVSSSSAAAATKKAKETEFYKLHDFPGAVSHVDDKFGVDVDEIYAIADILSDKITSQYQIELIPKTGLKEDDLHIGYLPINKIV